MAEHITLGTYVGDGAPPAKVFCDDPQLRPHVGTPWLQQYVHERHGVSLRGQSGPASGSALSVPASFLAPDPLRPARHGVFVGKNGSGKSRFLTYLLREQLRLGCSAVVLDVKEETLRQALFCALEAGVSPESITVIRPADPYAGVPGWNPFAAEDADIPQAVRQFVSVVKSVADSWGPRLQDVLTNAATVIASQGLSLLELLEFLKPPGIYRVGLLSQSRGGPAWRRFREEYDYFDREFAAYSKGEQSSAVGPVLNKLRSFVSTPYLRSLFCAASDTLDLPSLWQRQRVILVHLDAEGALGPDGTRLLAGMFAYRLYQTAMRQSGPVPVALSLDEMSKQQRYLGGALLDILAVARSQNLRLLAGCQFLGQMSDDLVTSLLTNPTIKAFFAMGPEDARIVARTATTGTGSVPQRIFVEADRGTHAYAYPVTDAAGKAVGVPDRAEWDGLRFAGDKMREIRVLGIRSGKPLLYAGGQEVTRFLRGLPPGCWSFAGPAPLQVVVTFPRPKVRVEWASQSEAADRMFQTLLNLPVQHALMQVDTAGMGLARVADMPFPPALPRLTDFLGNGRAAQEIADTEASRRRDIAALCGGAPPPPVADQASPRPGRTQAGADATMPATPTMSAGLGNTTIHDREEEDDDSL